MNEQLPDRVQPDPYMVDVHSMWDTIQGEGPFVGMPATFVRLAGCTLQCPLCDTDYTQGRRWVFTHELFQGILRANKPLVVFTGGEPFRQYAALSNVIHLLMQSSWRPRIQIETNGTLGAPDDCFAGEVNVTCSPKTHHISEWISARADCWKYVLQQGEVDPTDGLPTNALGYAHRPARPPLGTHTTDVFLQPLDEGDPVRNKANQDEVLLSCQRFGYRLCLQVHKIIGVR